MIEFCNGIRFPQHGEAKVYSALIACEQLIAESFARADADRRGSVADLFVDDGWQRLGTEEMHGREIIRSTMGARDGVGRRTLHTVSGMRVVARPTDDELHVSYNLVLYLLSGESPCIPQSLASVTDICVAREGRWWLQSRDMSVQATHPSATAAGNTTTEGQPR